MRIQGCTPTLINNTVTQNRCTSTSTAARGGGIEAYSGSYAGKNNIVWDNYATTNPEFYGTINFNYSCSSVSFSGGTGNITGNPQFVSPNNNDFHFLSSSPCVDTGDPNSPLDPDGSRADMGALYYNHGGPTPNFSVDTSPVNPPIVIPGNGGSFQYNVNVTNNGTTQANFALWNKVRSAGGSWYLVFGPITRSLPGGASPSRILAQTIAGTIPAGTNTFITYVGLYPNQISDSSYFTFTKSAIADGGPWISESSVTGDMFDEYTVDAGLLPSVYSLQQNYPNPFNPLTTISFSLPQASLVNLSIYDVNGQLVTVIVNGWRNAGTHEVTFNGSGLASGVYLYKLTAKDFRASGKMALVK